MKIIQIVQGSGSLFCLSDDGQIYERVYGLTDEQIREGLSVQYAKMKWNKIELPI